MSGFTAPVTGGSKKIENVELIPSGFQLCTLITLADVGHQETQWGLRRMCKLVFEFPQHKRVFYEGDEPRPASSVISETLSLVKGSNLRDKWVPQMFGREITDQEAATFDIGQFLGKHFVATIQHSSDGKWANITAITPLTQQNCGMFQLQSPAVEVTNTLRFFHLSQGFESEAFANLTKGFREQAMNSVEGKEFAKSGGKFAEAKKVDDESGPSNDNYEWTEPGTTMQQYIEGGWTKQQLIDAGKLRLKQSIAPPPTSSVAPPPSAPQTVAPPVTPQPTPVPIPVPAPAPAPAKPKLVFKDPSHTLEAFLEAGWTEEQIVEQGYATFQ